MAAIRRRLGERVKSPDNRRPTGSHDDTISVPWDEKAPGQAYLNNLLISAANCPCVYGFPTRGRSAAECGGNSA